MREPNADVDDLLVSTQCAGAASTTRQEALDAVRHPDRRGAVCYNPRHFCSGSYAKPNRRDRIIRSFPSGPSVIAIDRLASRTRI